MIGKLVFTFGPMGCGKTLDLLRTAGNFEQGAHKVDVMKPKMDTKGGESILSRLGDPRKVDILFDRDDNLYDILDKSSAEIFCIDEAQFLTKEQVDQLMQAKIDMGVEIYCWGRRTNFMRTGEGFEGATRLLQIATDVRELEGRCWMCGAKATLNGRFYGHHLITEGDPILIDDDGNDEEYHAICENCYNEMKYNKDR